MFLRVRKREKNGKLHRYWSVVENRRVCGGRVVQRQVLHLGELNDTQRAGWVRAVEALEPATAQAHQLALFPDDVQALPTLDYPIVQIRLDRIQLRRSRQWGACWLTCQLWEMLGLDGFWNERLGLSRKGIDWRHVLKTLVAYRLIDPGIHLLPDSEFDGTVGLRYDMGDERPIASKPRRKSRFLSLIKTAGASSPCTPQTPGDFS